MREDRVLGLVIVLFGAYLLLRNTGVIAPLNWAVIWPLLLVGAGIWLLTSEWKPRDHEFIMNGERVNVPSSPIARLIAGLVVGFILLIVGLIVFGAITPFVILFVPLLPLLIFFRLGIGFLRLLISISIMGIPVLLIILILGLLL